MIRKAIMSEDTDIISSQLHLVPVGAESPADDSEGEPENPAIVTSESKDSVTSAGDEAKISPKSKSKKRRNKRKKSYKENTADINENSKGTVKEDVDEDTKEGKTKMNMERRREMTTGQTCLGEEEVEEEEDNADGKIEREKSEAEDGANKEDDECIDIPASEELDGNARNKLYQQGLAYINAGKKNAALKCFMACLTGLAKKEGFAFLPQCLKQMADIYYSREEYEKAIQFIQAEKMYYETALINTSGLQKELEENVKEGKESSESDSPSDPEMHRAEEYENLARLCLDKQQSELALEYQGKATKLRQQLYGADHPLTKKSLDFFTVVYAEVGKQQYTESLQKFSEKTPEGSPTPETPAEGDTEQHLRRRRSGILRVPSQTEDIAKNKDRHVRFEEPEQVVQNRTRREEELRISQTILWVLCGVCIVLLTCMLVYMYCRLDPLSHTCVSWRSQVNYYYMRAKYLYYTWNPHSGNKFG